MNSVENTYYFQIWGLIDFKCLIREIIHLKNFQGFTTTLRLHNYLFSWDQNS